MTHTSNRHAPIGFAHRGASADAPENTLEAFALALEKGATGLESDVWITRDGVAVLDHDGVGIPESLRAELPAHVPSLDELYATCGRDFELSLDVKDVAAAAEAIASATRAGAAERLWLCHFSWRTVARWRELSPAVHLVDSTRRRHMRTPPPARAARMAALGIDAINLHWSDWAADEVAIFRAEGRQAWAWDLQETPVLERTLALGVDAVFSDHTDRMMAALRGLRGAA